jgi:thymidylate synthase (FAD)
MNLIQQSIEVVDPSTPAEWLRQLKKIEKMYRVCYKSEDKITDDSYNRFIRDHINHESPLEHCSITVIMECSRGIQQEFTRHRLAAYSIESTRWINYLKKQGGHIDFIKPRLWDDMTFEQRAAYAEAMEHSERSYNRLIELGLKPQTARDAFALALKSTVACTMNVRQWRHVFKERALNRNAHPDIRQLTGDILNHFMDHAPVFFADLCDESGPWKLN